MGVWVCVVGRWGGGAVVVGGGVAREEWDNHEGRVAGRMVTLLETGGKEERINRKKDGGTDSKSKRGQ